MGRASSTGHQPNWVPLDFRKAVVKPGAIAGSFVLTVSGDKPRDAHGGAAVKLEPLTYAEPPEYWKIELLWDSADTVIPIVTPFTVSMPLDQCRGSKGIEVVGQTKRQKISI
jgi:hypothetical protein